MKRIVTSLTLSMLLLPSVIYATEKETNNTDQSGINTSLILVDESYDGQGLIREFIYEETDKKDNTYVDYILVPESINKQVKPNDKESVKKVTGLLAKYYDDKKINNIEALNKLFLQFIPEAPSKKLSVSEEYAENFSENLRYSLEYIKSDEKITVPKAETELLKSKLFGEKEYFEKFVPKTSKKVLYEKTEILSDELETKWYESIITYIIFGSTLLIFLTLFIFFKRR